MTHSHAILYWNNHKTHPSLVHSRETINTGPTHPYLSYCNEIWGNIYSSNVKCLFTLHNKAIRLICNADRLAHTNAMFKDMSMLKLSEFVKYKTAIMMFNLFHGTLPIQLQRRFTKYSSVHSTRQNKSFVMVQVRTNIKAMCLSVYCVKLWNTLPDDIKNCTSVNILKKCLKKHFHHTIRPIHCNKLIIRTTL